MKKGKYFGAWLVLLVGFAFPKFPLRAQCLYVTGSQFGEVSAYGIGSAGALNFIGSVSEHMPGAFATLTADPTGKFLYVISGMFTDTTNEILAYSVGPGGSLSSLGPFGAPIDPFSMATSSCGASVSFPVGLVTGGGQLVSGIDIASTLCR